MTDSREDGPSPAPIISTYQWPKQARYIAGVMFVIALIGLVVFVLPIGKDLIGALLFAFILDIPIRFLARRTRLTYRWSATAVYVLLYIFVALLLFGGWKYIVDYLQGAIAELSNAASASLAALQGNQTVAGLSAPALSRLLDAGVAALLDVLSAPALLYANFAISVVHIGFLIFLSNLLIFSAYGARGSLCKWVPPALDREAALMLTIFDRVWSNYLAGISLFAFVLAVLSIIEYWLLGVPYPAVFGILTGLICLLPLIGGFLSGLVVFIPCLLLGSTRFTQLNPLVFALMVTLINDLLCTISYNFVALPIIGKLVKLPYWVVLSGTMLGFAVSSILFAFIVIPVFSTLRITYTYFLAKILGRDPFPGRERPDSRESGFLSQLLLDEPKLSKVIQ